MRTSAAITGAGCISAYGVGVDAAWRSLLDNRRAPETPRQHLGHVSIAMNAPSAEELKELSPYSGLTRPTRSALLALIAACEAWSAAKFMPGAKDDVSAAREGRPSFDCERTGLIVNRNFGQHQIIGQYYETLWTKGPSGVSGLQFVQTIANSLLGSLAMHLQLRGPSSMQMGPPAVCAAFDALRSGNADVMLAGGVDELSDYVLELCQESKLSCGAGSNDTVGQPYSPDSRGLIPSEGSAFFVLETPEAASARGARPLAYLKGFATVTDDRAWQHSAERNPRDIAEAIRRSLGDAGVGADEVGFISGGASGVPGTDQSELKAIAAVLPHRPAVFSVKGGFGETWGASGGLSMLAAVLAFRDNMLPPSTGVDCALEGCSANLVLQKAAPRPQGLGLVLSIDMTGQNTALVVGDRP